MGRSETDWSRGGQTDDVTLQSVVGESAGKTSVSFEACRL